MKIFTATSIKGGVTKTTSTVNLAHGLAQTGRRVLVIDADHQCNATLAICRGVQEEREGTFFDVMMKRRPVGEVIQKTQFEGLDIVQGSMWLSNANTELASQFSRESILRNALQNVTGYHYILIDTAPNTELVTVNAWVASDALIVPLTPSWFAMFGIRILEIQLADIRRETGREYPIFGVIVALDDHTRNSKIHTDQIREYFDRDGKEVVFKTVIPKNVQVEMATDEAQPIYTFAPKSTGASAYANLVEEFIIRAEGGAHG